MRFCCDFFFFGATFHSPAFAYVATNPPNKKGITTRTATERRRPKSLLLLASPTPSSKSNEDNDDDNKHLERNLQSQQETTFYRSKTRMIERTPRRQRSFLPPDLSKLEWLEQATARILDAHTKSSQSSPIALTDRGKWHEIVSLFNAWSNYQRVRGSPSPLRMEALLKVLVEQRRSGNTDILITVDLYNKLLNSWACAAHFHTLGGDSDSKAASQRAREILVLMQETYEQDKRPEIMPDATSFNLVLRVVCKVEGAIVARRVLAWMEYLSKSKKNVHVIPSRSDYIQLLDAYTRCSNSGSCVSTAVLADAFLRHMKRVKIYNDLPNTFCYNMAIKANNSHRNGREAAEHADRILEEMKAQTSLHSLPDVITYSCTYSSYERTLEI
jgi:hypothetical protein